MDRLSLVLTLMTGAVLTGSLTIAAFTLGYYGWVPVLIAAAVGFGASWPAAYLISRRIKRRDPGFDHRRVEGAGYVPDPSSPEV